MRFAFVDIDDIRVNLLSKISPIKDELIQKFSSEKQLNYILQLLTST
ncbi:hypothetical protein [Francisella persica]|nr:hypothetical protein [Francisella persica]